MHDTPTLILPGTTERLGNKFRDRRLSRKIGPKKLAQLTGLTTERIKLLEDGVSPEALTITLREMESIAAALRCQLCFDPFPLIDPPKTYTLEEVIAYAKETGQNLGLTLTDTGESRVSPKAATRSLAAATQ